MATVPIINAGFESGDLTGWTAPAGVTTTVDNLQYAYTGTYACNFYAGTPGIVDLVQTDGTLVWEGVTITASCYYRQGGASSGHNTGQIVMKWYNVSDAFIGESVGNLIKSSDTSNKISTVTGTAPAGAVYVRLGLRLNKNRDDNCGCDAFTWDLEANASIDLTFPAQGSTYGSGESVPFRVTIASEMPVTSVEYKVTNTSTAAVTSVGTSSTAPYSLNSSTIPSGNYNAQASVTLSSGYTALSDVQNFTIGAPPAPDTREYKASNAYTYLVAGNFQGIANTMPSTSRVVGVKGIFDYSVKALIRSKDKDIADPTVARYQAAFDMVPTISFEMALLDGTGTYTSMGSALVNSQAITRSDFLVQEDGTSEGLRWTVLQGDDKNLEVGGATDLFGLTTMSASDFLNKSIGIRCYPNLGSKPSYADSGDACFRVAIDKFRLQVYFDPGSVDYYFASPDGTKVIKAKLIHFCVDKGDLRNGDAEGSLQISYGLELKDGTQTYIGPDWSMHAEYPPTEANKVADMVPVTTNTNMGMEYNGLPTQADIIAARSRYQFISHNFYGDANWDAMYGVNGAGKAFSFNGDWFYKICTNPDETKDKPRHISDHHQHLALGFPEGRVDISVVGEPYNYSGFLGASSWAIGDTITGLLPLSGTILGVFGSKSIWGISGTTVDNFATQLLVPRIGAIEYTVVDMGYPIYANAYGIYNLSQTQQYGDYLGTPMSVDVSPWLRPRLIKADNSAIGTVAAWPVRHKNQYKLCFKDGYILTMTLNAGSQQAPTFSMQRYDVTE